MTAIEEIFHAEWGRLLAGLIHLFGDFDVAEEALQEAFAIAVTEWSGEVPRNPRAWLYGTARHKALDRLRRQARFAGKQAELAYLGPVATTVDDDEESGVPDERLRLIFTCCHPALAEDAQVALTLRTLCGLTTEEIARAFLVPVATMAQRLVRAKSKIRGAAIPYRVPPASELRERLSAVVAVVYLVFNEGYAAASGAALVRHDLCAEAIRLARMLRMLMPDPELDALLALMLLHDSRRHARVDDAGEVVLLADQDRSQWDRAEIDEGRALLQSSMRRSRPGTYALEATIAAVHADAPSAEETDWRQIVAIYERLYALHPTPVVALNQAVAVSMADGPAAALPLVDALSESLAGYHLLARRPCRSPSPPRTLRGSAGELSSRAGAGWERCGAAVSGAEDWGVDRSDATVLGLDALISGWCGFLKRNGIRFWQRESRPHAPFVEWHSSVVHRRRLHFDT